MEVSADKNTTLYAFTLRMLRIKLMKGSKRTDTCARGKSFLEISKQIFQYKMHSSNTKRVLPVTTTDRLLKVWLPSVLCNTDIGMPTIPVLPRNGDVERGLAFFVLVGM
jgi:hypothetical protein